MAELRVRVGAAVDGSFNQVFKSITAAAESAQKKISSDEKTSANLHAQLLKDKLSAEKAILKEQISETAKVNDHVRQLSVMRNKQQLRDREASAKAERDSVVRQEESAARDVARIQDQASKVELIRFRQALKDKERAEKQASGGGRGGGGRGRDMGYRMGYWASRNLSPVTPMLSYAQGVASDLVHGAGVNFDIGSMVQKHLGLQAGYQALSNQGYQEHGKGASSIRQDPNALQAEGMQIAKQYGFDPEKVREATTAFVDLTGNLEGARHAMGDLAKLSNATTTDLVDMASAAAAVQVKLDQAMGDDTQGKAQALQDIMRIFAGQGRLGAVELKSLAVNLAKLAAVTDRFSGSREQVFASVGVLAQESRAAGGSASASQAATSVTRFASMLTQKNTVKAFAAQGINVFADKGQTKLRPMEELILESLSHTKGNAVAMGGLFKNVMANRAVEGFENIYNSTKGTNQEKLAAVDARWQELAKAAMTAREVEENNARVMEEGQKKAVVFQNQLQEIAGAMTNKVMPALETLAPKTLAAADAIGHIVEYLASNPFAIIPALLTAAISKSAVEQSLRTGIESIFHDDASKGGPGVINGGGQGALGNIAALLTITAITVTTFKVGSMFIDEMFSSKDKREKEDREAETNAENVESVLNKQIADGSVKKETLDDAKKKAEALESQRVKEPGLMAQLPHFLFSGDPFDEEGRVAKGEKDRDDAMQAEHARLLKQIATGTLNVRVTNQPSGPAPVVNESARTDSSESGP